MKTQPPTTSDIIAAKPSDEPIEAQDRAVESQNVQNQSHTEDKLVPVNEAIRYRKRAQAAEQQLETLRSQFDEMRGRLDESQEAITSLERRQKIDAMLSNSGAIDLEAARLLTEVTVTAMDTPDVKLAIDDLRRHKPYLFQSSRNAGPSAMSPQLDHDSQQLDAAEQAATTGDRRDLLHYLRLRRKNG